MSPFPLLAVTLGLLAAPPDPTKDDKGDLKKLEGDRSWKVVALTAHAMPADRERALAAGFDGYITKPIDVRALPAEVARYLSSPAPP